MRSSDNKGSNRYLSDRGVRRRSKERREGWVPRERSKHRRSTDRQPQYKSEDTSSQARVKRKSPDHENKSHHEHHHSQTSRFEEVRIKQEPLSDDEEQRRKKRQRRERERQAKFVKKDREDGSRSEAASGSTDAKDAVDPPKDKPNFGLSGKLAEDTNVYNGIVVKYNEPVEARKPNKRWRLYPFKGDEPLPMLPIHRQSAYLLGRERRVADIPIDHPSCSKQHAVLQFRMVTYKKEDGNNGRRVRPYIIDLESANGTFVNNNKIEPKRYVELMERDVIKFGFSSREYVLLHEGSVGDENEADVPTDAPSDLPPSDMQST